MCGIAGIWSLDGDIRQSEKITMNDLLAHRGPDDEGSVGRYGSLVQYGAHRSVATLKGTSRQLRGFILSLSIVFVCCLRRGTRYFWRNKAKSK